MRTPASQHSLPPPHPEAQATSHALAALIRSRIEAAGGAIPFEHYQDLALYSPGLGYYSGGLAKLGAAGDFTTAPELTPMFGRTLAHAVAPVLGASRGSLLELGAGTGALARDLLTRLVELDVVPREYLILELSGDLAARQRQSLAPLIDAGLAVRWLTALPDEINGVILANEVLDAVPTRLLVRAGDAIRERYVVTQGETLAFEDRLVVDRGLAEQVRGLFPDIAGPYVSEVNPRAQALAASLAACLGDGVGILIDYGFAAREFYHPHRSMGTLMCHYRHFAHGDPLWWPGLQDITSHVDFTAVAVALQEAGADVLLFSSQAQFLLAHGLLDGLQVLAPGSVDYMQASLALQRLVSPAEMGELFKVMVFGKGPSRSTLRSAARPIPW